VLSAIKIPIDIFPQLNLPTIYVIESYGGMFALSKWRAFSPHVTGSVFICKRNKISAVKTSRA